MKQVVLAAVLVLGAATPGFAQWTEAAAKVAAASVVIETDQGGCTGWVIDAVRHYVLTAAHCDGPGMTAESVPAVVVAKDRKRDLMVVEVKGIGDDRPALVLASEDVKIGDTVASFGYGYSLETPLFRIANISATGVHIEGLGPFVVIDAAFVPGQSGGPVVNQAGEVVMIVQRASDRVGLGVDAAVIKKRVGKYFGKAAK